MRNHRRFWIGTLLAAGMTDFAGAATIAVNTATDDFGSVGSNCSLREAIQSANTNADFGGCTHTGAYGNDVITLPTLGAGGFFTLTRIGTDDTNATGDLDIAGNVQINGVSASNSAIRGNTNDPDSSRSRLMHVISGTVTLNDLTLRDGLEDNQTAGGGLRTEPGSTTTLNRVVVFLNIADGNAGGILNRGTMTINASTVSTNQTRNALNGGGGIFNDQGASLTVNDSQILSNTAKCSGDSQALAQGGGIYSATGATLTLDNSVVDGNVADGRRVVDQAAGGGGIYASGSLVLVQSSVTNNEAVGTFGSGGGIEAEQTIPGLVDRTVVAFNLARSTALSSDSKGGGIAAIASSVTVQDSVIASNEARGGGQPCGGGLLGNLRLMRSTVANNFTSGLGGCGGGMQSFDSGVVINSTFIGNHADGYGGGLFFGDLTGTGSGTKVFNSTFSGNTARFGGGLYQQAGNPSISNTVLAGNTATNDGPDCSGTITSNGNSLVQTTIGCTIVSNGQGDQLNVTAGLAAVANNGGPIAGSSLGVISGMQTRAPLPNSPLIDAGNPTGCRENGNVLLTTDQIGNPRAIDDPNVNTNATCDIGAIESIDGDVIFANGFE